MGDATQPGSVVGGRFLLGRKLGRGGYATVWRASDTLGGPEVAVKMLHRELRLSATAQDRLRREVEVLCQLDHPNIARAVDVQLERAEPFFAMELIEGVSLDRAIGERARGDAYFPDREARSIFEQICRALAQAHAQGIVHRDLKPANVMVDVRGATPAIKVLDFGLAKLLRGSDSQTTEGRTLGSLSYMSPEQGAGLPVDERTDIFALGVLLFELITLRRTWARDQHGDPLRAYCTPVRANRFNVADRLVARIASEGRTLPSTIRSGVLRTTDAFLAKLLAIRPEERFASVSEVLANLPVDLTEDDQLRTRSMMTPAPRSGTPLRLSPPPTDGKTELQPQIVQTQLTPPPGQATPSYVLAAPPGQNTALGWKIAVAVLSVMCVALATVAVLALQSRSKDPVTNVTLTPPVVPVLSARPGTRVKATAPTPSKPVDNPAASGGPPASPSPVPGGSTARAVPTPTKTKPDPLQRVRQLYSAAARNPTDIGALQQLEAAIRQATLSIEEPKRRSRINRIARSSAELGDLAGIYRAVEDLEEALR